MGRSRSSSSVSKRRYFNPAYLPQETKALGFALHCLCCCFPLRLGSPDSCSCNMREIFYCHVLHIIHSGIIESLRFLLEESMLLKFGRSLAPVGAGIGSDCRNIFKDYNVSVKAVEDLSYLANRKLGRQPKVWGLRSLIEMLVCKELLKPNKIRLGNWEVDILSKYQLEYAATDAFASWHLYQVLKSLPDAKDSTEI
ncbi:hypothetical protein K2173_016717 [Erythroxylum novogranatense]|uniref:3'-5' exonuclease n=1 Tax=Erythroxylum novogranatense TaxID=1862640 RepID=A0AAV8SHA2_9ROSI|nr:hypothetical protein K2173_016717 [Erythroxylum novogranatense]